MKASHAIAIMVSRALEEEIEENPTEVFLAFAGLFCSMGIKLGAEEEDIVNLIRNLYKDILAESKGEMH